MRITMLSPRNQQAMELFKPTPPEKPEEPPYPDEPGFAHYALATVPGLAGGAGLGYLAAQHLSGWTGGAFGVVTGLLPGLGAGILSAIALDSMGVDETPLILTSLGVGLGTVILGGYLGATGGWPIVQSIAGGLTGGVAAAIVGGLWLDKRHSSQVDRYYEQQRDYEQARGRYDLEMVGYERELKAWESRAVTPREVGGVHEANGRVVVSGVHIKKKKKKPR